MFADGLLLVVAASLVIDAAALPGDALPVALPSIECYRHINAFDGVCPLDCPLAATCNTAGTSMCIEMGTCPIVLNRGEPVGIIGSLRCEKCAVFGCETCEDETRCKPTGCGVEYLYNEEDGACYWEERKIWFVIVVVLGVASVWITIDLLRAYFPEATNVVALDAGIQSRFHAKLRKTWEAGSPAYGFWSASLHWHEEGVAPVGGPGFPIFMNCITLVGALGIWLSVMAMIFGPDENPATLTPCSREADIIQAIIFDAVNSSVLSDNVSSVLSHNASDGFFPRWALSNYVGAVVISLVYAVVQARLWGRLEESSISQHRYCIEAKGFPPEASDKGELLAFFVKQLTKCMLPPGGIEYISIAYDYDSDTKQRLDTSVSQHLKLTKAILDHQEGFHELCEHASITRSDGPISGSSDEEGEGSSSTACPFWIRVLGYFMVGIDFTAGSMDDQSSEDGISSEELDNLPNAGHVFVVMKSEALAVGFASVGRIIYDDDNGEEHVISLKVTEDEPVGIAWERFDTVARDNTCKRCIVVALMFIPCLMVWFVCYLPFAHVLIVTSGYESDLTVVLETMLGLVVSLGNCFIGAVVEKFVDYIGFTSWSNRDLTKLAMIVPCNLVNCIADFFLVTYIVWSVTEREHSTFADFTSEWFALLFPSYVLVPYLAEPFMTLLVPYIVAVLRIKQDKKITPEMAEEALLPPDNDIINPAYNDIIGTSSIICFSFLFAPSYGHKMLFPLLIVQCVVIYVQSRFKILRWMSYTFFFSKSLHDSESMFWALPLGFLAAAVERQYFETTGHISSILTVHSGLVWFCLHVLCHTVFLKFVLPQFSGDRVSRNLSYVDLIHGSHVTGFGQLATYLNTNPVEVLKSHVIGEDGKAQREFSTGDYLVYYRKDKRYLQPEAHRSHNVKGWQGLRPMLSARQIVKNAVEARNDLTDAIDKSKQILLAGDSDSDTEKVSSEEHKVLLAPDGLPFTKKALNGSLAEQSSSLGAVWPIPAIP